MHSICRNLYRIYSGNIALAPLLNTKNKQLENIALGSKKYLCSHEISDDVMTEVSQGDEGIQYKVKVLVMEMEFLRQEGELVPPTNLMKAKHFNELLRLKHRNARKKYLDYLFKLFKTKENELRKKREKALAYEEFKKTQDLSKDLSIEEFAETYDLSHNNLFLRIRDKTINNLYNSKLINAIQYGQKLIFDCGFHTQMTTRENINCAKQIMLLFGDNRIHDDPFDLHLCNYDKSSTFAKNLEIFMPPVYNPEFPLNIHKESYLDLYPKEKLVYLTPHCREEMEEYDHDTFYIIGSIVDKANQAPLSLAKAKQQNIKMMKFPLDRYLSWTSGSCKSLTLNQVVLILLDLKKTGDWRYALRHVPRRKVARDEDVVEKVKEKLYQTKKRWSARVDLNNLNYNRDNSFQNRNAKPFRRQVSVTSLFRDN